MSKRVARGILLNDMHTDSQYGLTNIFDNDPTFDCTLGGQIRQIWRDMVEKWRGKVDFVIADGDLIEGFNKKERGALVHDANLENQARHAAQMLAEVRAPRYYITMGSIYHVYVNPRTEQIVALELQKQLGSRTVVDFDEELFVDIPVADGVFRIHVTHKTSTGQFPTTGLVKQMQWAIINDDMWGKVDMLVRAHLHQFWELRRPDCVAIISPGWKARDPYLARMGDLRMIPEIGYVIIDIFDDKSYAVEPFVCKLKGQIRHIRME